MGLAVCNSAETGCWESRGGEGRHLLLLMLLWRPPHSVLTNHGSNNTCYDLSTDNSLLVLVACYLQLTIHAQVYMHTMCMCSHVVAHRALPVIAIVLLSELLVRLENLLEAHLVVFVKVIPAHTHAGAWLPPQRDRTAPPFSRAQGRAVATRLVPWRALEL